jgi:hypothetical protein
MSILSPSGHISGLNPDKASFLKWLATQSFLSHPNEVCYRRLPTQHVQRIYGQHRNEADRHVNYTLKPPRFCSMANIATIWPRSTTAPIPRSAHKVSASDWQIALPTSEQSLCDISDIHAPRGQKICRNGVPQRPVRPRATRVEVDMAFV